MRILFACGGTAGHINPAIAVAQLVRQKDADAAVLFVGNPNGMEARLVKEAGFDFAAVRVLGIQRQLSRQNLVNNVKAIAYLTTAGLHAKKIIKRFAPDIVFGTGGYVSGPVLREAAKMGIKTLTHESNAFPGVTTKLLSRYVDAVLIAVPKAADYLPRACKTVVTGNPVRLGVAQASRDEARKKLEVGERPCLLSFGGSNGARTVNAAVAKLMAWYCKNADIYHIHATGRFGVQLLPQLLKDEGISDIKKYPQLDIREYIDDMADCLAAADLVICRAGALTLTELQAAGKASILIPSPNVAENHQYYNALVLQKANAAVLIEEKDLTGELLIKTVRELIADKNRLAKLGKNAAAIAITDANERIYEEIKLLLKK
ncbi:MAG: undecaprenyldiphospho-muramoylpentapeptide beta-N-acetylglucosaminyltransferase [Hydrogenoanaerobacterium sp.]